MSDTPKAESVEELAEQIYRLDASGPHCRVDIERTTERIKVWLRSHGIDTATMQPMDIEKNEIIPAATERGDLGDWSCPACGNSMAWTVPDERPHLRSCDNCGAEYSAPDDDVPTPADEHRAKYETAWLIEIKGIESFDASRPWIKHLRLFAGFCHFVFATSPMMRILQSWLRESRPTRPR
jgi:hypothetical protein